MACFDSGAAYGVEFQRYHASVVAGVVRLGKLGREQLERGRIEPSGEIEAFEVDDESAYFYWMLRYKSIVRDDRSYEARDYHDVRDLEKAISL